MPRRRKPKPEIIEYKQLKTAAGGGGPGGPGGGGSSGGGSGFRAGDDLVCKIIDAEPGGYAVVVRKNNLPGFLPTQALLQTGEEILAKFVCEVNHRMLLSARFSTNISKLPATQNVRGEDRLDRLDEPPDCEVDSCDNE
jgi:hypothetical protein